MMVDRGLRDSVSFMQTLSLDVSMPPFLDSKRQFSVKEANQSRCITEVWWIVEAANHRIKDLRYSANTIQNSSLCYLPKDSSVAGALISRYQRSIATSEVDDTKISQQTLRRLRQEKIPLVNNQAAMGEWLHCSARIHKVLCSNLSIIIHRMTLDKSLTAKLSQMTHSYRANILSVSTLDGKGTDTVVCKKKKTTETGSMWILIITAAVPNG